MVQCRCWLVQWEGGKVSFKLWREMRNSMKYSRLAPGSRCHMRCALKVCRKQAKCRNTSGSRKQGQRHDLLLLPLWHIRFLSLCGFIASCLKLCIYKVAWILQTSIFFNVDNYYSFWFLTQLEEQASREVIVFPNVSWKESTDWNRIPSIYPGCIGLNGTSFWSLQKTVFFPLPMYPQEK